MPVNMINVICNCVWNPLILVGLYHPDLCCREIKFNDLRSVFRRYPDGTRNFPFGELHIDRGAKLLPIYTVHLFWLQHLDDFGRAASNSAKTWSRYDMEIPFCLSLIFIALGISLVVNPFTMVKYTVIFAGWIF